VRMRRGGLCCRDKKTEEGAGRQGSHIPRV
jgi:hypothetical protein